MKSIVELSRIKQDGTDGMKLYFEKGWTKHPNFPFKLGDMVLVKILPTRVIIQKIDQQQLNKFVGGYSGKK